MTSASTRPPLANHVTRAGHKRRCDHCGSRGAIKDLMISPSIHVSHRNVVLTEGSYKSLRHVVDAVALP
jgi:hypothetical protein